MKISFSACKQTQPPLMSNFPAASLISMEKVLLIPRQKLSYKDKVVVVMGSTGTGKSRLSIDLATRFDAEVINSDKIQFYKGLDVVTNKVTEEECRGVPHHLLGFIDPDDDFTAQDFIHHATLAADQITQKGRLPIIVGGSNSMIEALVSDDVAFKSKYECCFLWVDVSMPVLHSFVSKRVDQMVGSGLVQECKEFFDPSGDYSRGIRRAIGVPEMHDYFMSESLFGGGDSIVRGRLLEEAIDKIKANTCGLACRQLQKILKLAEIFGWRMHRLDATEVFLKRGEDRANEAWERLVAGPGTRIVGRFLFETSKEEERSLGFAPSTVGAAPAVMALVGPT